jgi:hypothetical protein
MINNTEKTAPIRSISYSQEEIINNILALHAPHGVIDADVTYSKGVFYKSGVVRQPKLKFDLEPQTPDTIRANSGELPLTDNCLDCIMFDPPFVIAGKTYKTNTDDNSSKIAKRFSAYENFEQLKEHYYKSLVEFYRVLKNKGIVIFKCQNTISGGKQLLSHYFIISTAISLGFYPKDEFVLLSKAKMTSFGGRWAKQQHAMKYHSYFLVLKKDRRRINYDLPSINNVLTECLMEDCVPELHYEKPK